MMKASNKAMSASQKKRLHKMKQLNGNEKARTLNMIRLKEATQVINEGKADKEKYANKAETARAAYLVKQEKAGGHE